MTTPLARNIHAHRGVVTRADRARLFGTAGATLWLTGLSGSGKSTIAAALEHRLLALDVPAYRLDGDNLRCGLTSDLGFSLDDRAENIRRISELARLFADAGLVAIVSAIAPLRADRARARRIHENDAFGAAAQPSLVFLEVHVDAPITLCESRDPKGLYRKARAGELPGFTGIDSPYQTPEHPDLTLPTASLSVDACVDACIQTLRARAVILPRD